MIEKGFFDNLNADPRLIGLETLMAPFISFTSSQRSAMFSGHLVQALIVDGAELPMISTGYESIIGDYDFNTARRDQGMYILGIFYKYKPNIGVYQIKENPSMTVVYLGSKTNKVHYFNIDKYTKGSDGYGYLNKWINTNMLTTGNYIDEDVEFYHSPIKENNIYKLGVNANVAYMTLPQVAEDAFVISKSFAEKLKTTAIKTINIKILPDQIPLNLYSDDDEYKFFPDISETVRDDGILMGFRKPTENTFITDMSPYSLVKPQPLHDILYYAPAGSTILDVNFYINKNIKIKSSKTMFNQIFKYYDFSIDYYKSIIDLYNKCIHEGYAISNEFNTLVTRAMALLSADGQRVNNLGRRVKMKLMSKKEPVEFIQMSLTYMYEIPVNKGFKITGSHGN